MLKEVRRKLLKKERERAIKSFLRKNGQRK